MNLPRRTYLELADVSLPAFQSLQRRGQVPFVAPYGGTDTRDATGYAPMDALMLAFAERIARHVALDRSAVAELVSEHYHVPVEALRQNAKWLAVIPGPLGDMSLFDPANPGETLNLVDHPYSSVTIIFIGDLIEGFKERANRLGITLEAAD